MNRIFSRKVAIIVIVGIGVLGVAGFLSRGWIRTQLLPGLYSVTQGHSMQGKVDKEMEKLGKPFESLGYQKIDKKQECILANAHLLRTGITCTYRIDASQIVARSWLSPAELVINGTQLQRQLQQNGWQGDFVDERDTTSLHEFVTSMSKNSDAIPDAYYDKQLDGMSCTFTTVAASASPSPVAMSTHLICDKTYQIF